MSLRCINNALGTIHKTSTQYRKKLTPSSCPHWLNPSCPCRHTINFEKSESSIKIRKKSRSYTKKCRHPHL